MKKTRKALFQKVIELSHFAMTTSTRQGWRLAGWTFRCARGPLIDRHGDKSHL